MTMRVGLVGSGFWAREVHAPGILRAVGVEFASIFARDARAAAGLAAQYGVVAYDDFDAFLESVDVVDFAVTPDAQADLAVRAAGRGKHLLLEKPTAFTGEAAHHVADAADLAGVSSVVFTTARFQAEIEEWLAEAEAHRWVGGTGRWITSAMSDPSAPWASSTWRQQRGGLWDIGAHALTVMLPVLGSVTGIEARSGGHRFVECLLEHDSGAISTLGITIHAPVGVDIIDLALWGEAGISIMPRQVTPVEVALGRALGALVASAQGTAVPHPCDARFGAELVATIERIQLSLDANLGQVTY